MSRGNVRVRPATMADVPGLVDLCEHAATQAELASLRTSRTTSLSEQFTRTLSAPTHTVLVAVDDHRGEIVGLAVTSESVVGAIGPIPVINVNGLLVAPQHRRRGVGRALLAATVHLADERGVDHITATTTTTSRDANRYLARLGFAPLAVRRIAPSAKLRHTLGISEAERLALRRRATLSGRRARAALASRVVGRGA